MSWQENLRSVEPYVAGEQPKLDEMIKLNTNENPYPPSPKIRELLADFDTDRLRLYPNPNADELRSELAIYYGLEPEQIFIGNGSDEVLSLAFLAFFNGAKPLLMPDISYSFYPVYCELYGIINKKVPLTENFQLKATDYFQENAGIVFANPNAPTGIPVGLDFIEEILQHNLESIVLVDEAYIDFSGPTATALPLLKKYDNLVVTRTFSKSRSLAGIRLGLAFGDPLAIARLYDVKNSFNSYPIDSLAQLVGLASLKDNNYYEKNLAKLVSTREKFKQDLHQLGFEQLDSQANFVFAHHPNISAQQLFEILYAEKIIVRHWNAPRIYDWLRITIGTDEEMMRLIEFLKEFLE